MREKSIKNRSFAHYYNDINWFSPYLQEEYAHTNTSISLPAKAGNNGYHHLYNLRSSLDRPGRFLYERRTT